MNDLKSSRWLLRYCKIFLENEDGQVVCHFIRKHKDKANSIFDGPSLERSFYRIPGDIRVGVAMCAYLWEHDKAKAKEIGIMKVPPELYDYLNSKAHPWQTIFNYVRDGKVLLY